MRSAVLLAANKIAHPTQLWHCPNVSHTSKTHAATTPTQGLCQLLADYARLGPVSSCLLRP